MRNSRWENVSLGKAPAFSYRRISQRRERGKEAILSTRGDLQKRLKAVLLVKILIIDFVDTALSREVALQLFVNFMFMLLFVTESDSVYQPDLRILQQMQNSFCIC